MNESTIEQAFILAFRSQQSGRNQDAEKLYRAILDVQSDHALANYNLGILKLGLDKPHESIVFLKAALHAEKGQSLFWTSYIDALLKLGLITDARAALEEAKSFALDPDAAVQAEQRYRLSLEEAAWSEAEPLGSEREKLVSSYSAGNYSSAEQQAIALTKKYPHHPFGWKVLGTVFLRTNRTMEAEGMIRQALCRNAQDADAHRVLGAILSELKRWDEAEKSYREAIRLKPDHSEAYIGLGVFLKNIGRINEAEAAYRKAILIRPEYAQAHSNLGNLLSDRGFYSEAEESYRNAIRLKPDYAEAYSNLGILLKDLGRVSEAEASFGEAIRLKADCPEAHINLANVLKDQGRLFEAEHSCRQAICIKPNFPEAHSLYGIVLNGLGRLSDAEASLREATRLKLGFNDALWNLSLNLLLQSRFEEGWKLYEHRWGAVKKLRKSQHHFPRPLWLGQESLDGKTILIHAEQGLGDTLQFCRYLPMVKRRGARVIFEVFAPLMGILADLDGVDELVVRSKPLPEFDYHCPLMSLPLAFNTTLDTIPAAIPYLGAQPERVARWESLLGQNGFKVGVCWKSSDLIKERSIPLECLAGLSKIPGVRLISLHKGEGEKELATLPTGLSVEALGSEFDSDGAFLDTAAVIQCCDLVITTDTSVAHLAGALGARTWVMLPFVPDWRWMMEREDSPWYPTARLFRQSAAGDWQTVVDRMGLAIKAEFDDFKKMKWDSTHVARLRQSA